MTLTANALVQDTQSQHTESETDSRIQTFKYARLQPGSHLARLDRLHRMAAANLSMEGDVTPEKALQAVQDPVFDDHDHTHIISIEHQSGRLAGTFSFTLDGVDGMPVSRHFEDDIAQLRQQHRLLNAWRFSMSPLFHSALLRKQSFEYFWAQAGTFNVDTVVLYFNERLLNFYKRKMVGEVVASKTISFDGKAQLPVLLYACPLEENLAKQPIYDGGVSNEFSVVM
ncbi:hypothetical protein ACFOND_03870 [Reinekea marina]|uniref:N-acyl amino acid synthase FeeM catalytic core domain-containing protein n=2 Tax=Reinekea marina TaxID=1310421 RepID=A0ABV7WRU4_9GAMM